MDTRQNNQSANNFADTLGMQGGHLQVPKQSEYRPKRSPFKIRKKTTVGFQRAEWENAEKNVNERSVKYYKGEKVPFNIQLSNVRIYGPGIYLFFTFSKRIFFVMLILSLIALIPIFYNAIVGENYDRISDTISKRISLLSIGNLHPERQTYSSLADKLVNALPTMIISIIFFVFYIYWSLKSKEQVQSVRKSVKMLSYQVVQVIKFPKEMTQGQLFHYMSQWGEVKEISAVKNNKDTIYYCKKIYNKTLRGKEILLQREKMEIPSDQDFEKDLQKRQKELQKLYQKLDQQEKIASKQVIKYYVTYQSPQERQTCLDVFLPYSSQRLPCFRLAYPQDLKIRDQQIYVKPCHTQPAGIIWENAHITWKTRWIRLALQSLLILLLIAIGFVFILYLSALQPPSTTSSIDSSAYDETSILTVTDIAMIRSWCLSNSDLVDANPESDYGQLCEEYVSYTFASIMITIGISIAIVLIKLGLKHTVIYLSKFMRYKTITQQTTQTTKNLFITYLFTSIIIIVLMKARFGSLVPKELIIFLTDNAEIKANIDQMNQFQDIVSGWYLDVGYQIWLTWLILAVTPVSLIFTYHFPLKKITHYLAQRQVLQRRMEYYLEQEEFQIFDHYANIALIMFVGLVFSPGIPILLPMAALGLGIRFLYFKYIFINYSKIPKPLDESLNTLMFKYLSLAIIFHLLVAIWMYGVDELFDHSDSFVDGQFYDSTDSAVQRFFLIFFKRCVDSWYLTILLIFYLGFFFFRHFIEDFKKKCCGKQEGFKAHDEMLKQTVGNGGYVRGLASQRTLAKSYKIQNNPDYIDILAIIQRKLLAATCAPPKRK